MSKEFLLHLNGSKTGSFSKWLEEFNGEPRISWYPSSGRDFRDLLYLSRQYSAFNPGNLADPQAPDIFLHTDYYPWENSNFLDVPLIYADANTEVTVKSIEELPRCGLSLNEEIVYFQDGSSATDRVIFMLVHVKSSSLGEFTAPVIYAFAENEVFCAKKAIPYNAKFSHIVHVRYGGGCGGGGNATGIWLLNVLKKLKCECIVTDSHYANQSGDTAAVSLYPELGETNPKAKLERIRLINGASWSGHGDVSWNLVK